MPKLHFIAMALAGTALTGVPANAGGLLGGGAANCLCQAVHGITSGGSPEGATSITRGARQHGALRGAAQSKQIGNPTVAGNVTGSVNVTVARSTDRHSGRAIANIGLAGRVSGAAGLGADLNGVRRSVELAGKSSTHASADKRIGPSAAGLGAAHGKVANVSVLNESGGNGRSMTNVAVLNRTGGTSGKVANVSILNKTGTTGRSLANVALLNGGGGTSGKIANVSVLNRTDTTGRSLVNASVLNGRHDNGNGNGNGNGGLDLPSGVRIINGVPCGPDGKPLTGASAATVIAMIGGKDHDGGSSHGSGSQAAGNSRNGSASAGSTSSQSGKAASAGVGGQPRERDSADRKDLWWPPHPEQQSRDGRLNDH